MNTKKIAAIVSACAVLMMSACVSEKPDNSTVSTVSTDIKEETSVSSAESGSESTRESITKPAEISIPDEFSRIARLDSIPGYINENIDYYTGTLEAILRLYYLGILDGSINSSTFTPKTVDDEIPGKSSSAEYRLYCSEHISVGGALEYYTTDSTDENYLEMYNGLLPYLCNDMEGHIFLYSESSDKTVLQMNSYDEPVRHIFRYADNTKLEYELLKYVSDRLNEAAGSYYSGIKTKKILSGTMIQKYTSDVLPTPATDDKVALQLADASTLGGAMEYICKYKQFSPLITKLGYDSSGVIYPMSDKSKSDLKCFSNSNITAQSIRGGVPPLSTRAPK